MARTASETRIARYELAARPMIRAARDMGMEWAAMAGIAAPALMGGVWALPAPPAPR